MAKIYHDNDADLALIQAKKIAIIGGGAASVSALHTLVETLLTLSTNEPTQITVFEKSDEVGPGSLRSPCAELAKRLVCNSFAQFGAMCESHKVAGRLSPTITTSVWIARFRLVPPANNK